MNNLSLSQGPLSLSGKTAVITGAGAGIGQAIAELFAQAGAKVVVADVNAEGAERVAAGIREAGGQALAAVADVSQDTQVAAMLDQAIAGFGTLDILVNNAAIFPKKPFLEVQTEFWDKLQSVNLRGTFLCLREAIARMQAQGTGGSIVNISSVSSMQAVVYHNATYNASKAGVNSLTKTTALQYAREGIRCNSVHPGMIATDMMNISAVDNEEQHALLTAGIPMKRLGEPDDIGAMILFLLSDEAKYITGAEFVVDGGMTAQ